MFGDEEENLDSSDEQKDKSESPDETLDTDTEE